MSTVDASLSKWFENQMPSAVKKMSPRLISNPPLHLSDAVIKEFSPRIPLSVDTDEDKTIPRVCCSLDLARCIQGARHQFTHGATRLYLYAFNERNVIQPSVALTQESNRAGEVWIVPHRMSNWQLAPEVLGEMRLSEMSEDGTSQTWLYFGCKEALFEGSTKLIPEMVYKIHLRLTRTDYGVVTNVKLEGDGNYSNFIEALNEYRVTH